MPLTAAPTTTALLAVANDVPAYDPSYVSHSSGSKAWDIAKVQMGENVRVEHDVWQREDGSVYGSTRADFGVLSATVTDGTEAVHIHGAESVVVSRRDSTTTLTIMVNGKAVNVYLHGDHGNAVKITEKLS